MNISNFTDFDYDKSLNQAKPLEDYNLYLTDTVLQENAKNNGGEWIKDKASVLGEKLGTAEFLGYDRLANTYIPVLKTHDRFGNRLDTVDFHPSYHELMKIGVESGMHNLPWTSDKKGSYVARSVLTYLKQQVDEGTSCPLTMTFAVIPSLKINPDVAKDWLPLLYSNAYDSRFIPAKEKKGITFGMGMTEPQGGSDVRTNTSVARPIGNGEYLINGRKWFCSAPMSDALLVLAQTENGISCFLLPRFRPDGTKNQIQIQRLKDKLGNKSNASSEIEFHDCWAQIIGEEGRGVSNIMEMVRHTRLDCAVGSAASLHRAVTEAIYHTSQRKAFGKTLIDQPLMKNVLADLCIESEAATALAFRVSRSFDEALVSKEALVFSKVITAIGKFWVTKRAVYGVSEAMECLGGNGYVEESILPRLYRDIPVNSIWEGSGNVQCLDVMKSFYREPESKDLLLNELSLSKGRNTHYDNFVEHLEKEVKQINEQNLEFSMRRIVSRLAMALQANELLQHAPDFVSEAFCKSRLSNNSLGYIFGTLTTSDHINAIIKRTYNQVQFSKELQVS